MKFFVENWVLILVAFISGGMLVWPMMRRGGGAAAVGTGEAVRLINREKGVLVDVGEPGEFAAGHATGARNVPFGQLEGSKDLPTNKGLPILVMCPTGARAGRAAAILRKAGYEKAVAVVGGTRAWRDAQLPVERSADTKAAKGEDKNEGKGEGKGAKHAGKADKNSDRGADKGTEPGAGPADEGGTAKPGEPAAEKSA